MIVLINNIKDKCYYFYIFFDILGKQCIKFSDNIDNNSCKYRQIDIFCYYGY